MQYCNARSTLNRTGASSCIPSPVKISLISKGTHGPRIRYQADKNRYYTLILAKRPRSDAFESKKCMFECIRLRAPFAGHSRVKLTCLTTV